MEYVLLDWITVFKFLWKDIYDQLCEYLFNTGVAVYPVVCLSDTFLTVCVTWNSRRSGKMEITTLECPVDIYNEGNLQYISYQLNQILLDASLPDNCPCYDI